MDQQKNLNNRAQKWRRELFDNQNFIEDPGWKMEDDYEFWTPLDYFSQYFFDDFWEIVSTQSNVRAMQANEKKTLKSTAEEYRKLTGIHMTKIIAQRLKIDSFKASNGWMESFRTRHEIRFKQICGEAKDVDLTIVENWMQKLPEIIQGYEPKNIANETGLFFRALPSKTMTLKKDKCIGGKQTKERLTVLVCGFADGSMEKPLVIGKSMKPLCFKKFEHTRTSSCLACKQEILDDIGSNE
jgi:hypothetical protein